MRKFIFAVIVFVIAFAVPVTVYTLVAGPPDEFDSRESAAEGEEASINTSVPQIISVPVTVVDVGDTYSYRVRAIDEDGDTLEYEARLYPSWLSWDETLQVMEGTPDEEDIGLHRVEIVVTDGKWVQTHSFDISVTDEDAESVVPVTDAFTSPEASDSDGDSSGSSPEAVAGVTDTDADTDAEIEEPSLETDGPEPADPAEYGLLPIDESTAQANADTGTSSAQPSVLGEATTLPNTASFNGILALSLGVAVLAMGVFLWSDAQWDISGRLMTFLRYERGEQIGMDVRTGSKVKKRKIEL